MKVFSENFGKKSHKFCFKLGIGDGIVEILFSKIVGKGWGGVNFE